MAICKKIRITKNKLCIGDLRDSIEIQARVLKSPNLGTVDYNEQFTTIPNGVVRAAVQTVSGVTFFDGSNPEREITHIFYIRFIADLTTENWIKFESNLYDLIKVENMQEDNKFYKIQANLRGDSTRKPNFA